MVNQNPPKIEEYDFNSQRYTLARYADVDGFTEADNALQKELNLKGRKLIQSTQKINEVSQGIGNCNLAVSYLCDDFTSFQGAFIIRANDLIGNQTMSLIEHCLNVHGRMSASPLYRPQRISDIEFLINETRDEPKVYHLITGANHPEIAWREMYSVILAPQSAVHQVSLLERLRGFLRK